MYALVKLKASRFFDFYIFKCIQLEMLSGHGLKYTIILIFSHVQLLMQS